MTDFGACDSAASILGPTSKSMVGVKVCLPMDCFVAACKMA